MWSQPCGSSLAGVLDRLEALEAEYSQVLTRLSDPTVSQDPNELRVLSRRHKELEAVVRKMHDLKAAQEDVAVARELAADATGAERELGRDELSASEARVVRIENELRDLLVAKDPNEGRNVIVEIRGAEGGEEANLFAKDLFDMYQRYAADHRGWRVEVLDLRESELGGVDGVTFLVKGEDAWQRLHLEAGTHRVQRIPVTESQGASTRPQPRSTFCPRPRRSRSRSSQATCASTSTVPPVRAGSLSTRRTPPCA